MDNYIEFVNSQAKEKNRVFIIDTGEGREYYDKKLNIVIEDLSGWLLPLELENEAILARKNNESMILYDEYYCFARWYYDSQLILKIEFKNYKDFE